MKMKKIAIGLTFTTLIGGSLICFAQEMSSETEKNQSVIGAISQASKLFPKERVLGQLLGGALEGMHLTKKKIDDDLSEKAFKLYLERLDYGKQFLIEDDIDVLDAYEEKMDDELKEGKLEIVDKSKELLQKRIKEIEPYVMERLKKPFDFNQDVEFETDAKKREFASSMKELKQRWDKILQYEVVNRMITLKSEFDGENDKDSKASKKKNKLSTKKDKKPKNDKELEALAREKVEKSYSKIFKRLQEERRYDQLDKFYNSLARVFDPHTHYLIPEEKEDFDIDMSGQLQGIGALLREDGSYIKVERIIPGSASWKGKQLQAEDIILAVGQADDEPKDVVDMSLRDAVKLIRGKKGSEVRLTVKKPDGHVKIVSIIRDVVVIEESYAKSSIIEQEGNKLKIGYITLPKFYRDFGNSAGRNCSDDVKNELLRLKDLNVDGVVLDLRNNGGGALEDARIMSGLFIKKGPIVQVKSYRGATEILRDTDPKVVYKGPLVVLVNRFSASASEILAAAMQDYDRAIIIGEGDRTHGKGTVQAVLDLEDYGPFAKAYAPLGALKITIQMFYRVTGGSTQFKGVTPDIVLPDPYAYIESGEQSMDYAIPYAEVAPVEHSTWEYLKVSKSKLSELSEKRVKKSDIFKKISSAVEWYKERREQTKRKISYSAMLKDRDIAKEKSEELKHEDAIKGLKVTSFIKALDEETKEMKNEFEKGLASDPVIEEAFHVFEDIIKESPAKVSKK